MLWLQLLLLIGTPPDSIRFKPQEEFHIRFDLTFKQRPQASATKIDLDETKSEFERRTDISPLPYLNLHLKILKANKDEVRFKIVKTGKQTVANRKVELDKEFRLELGFTDDIKDRIVAYEYVVSLLSDKKKETSRIVIYFTADGDYLVNGVRRGKI